MMFRERDCVIQTREELRAFLKIETERYKKSRFIRYFGWLPLINGFGEAFGVYKLLVLLRKAEYHVNNKTKLRYIYQFRLKSLENRFSVRIPINVFDQGLQIPHLGPIVVHNKCRVGKNCRIHVGVNIGAEKDAVPVIGDDCYIGPGAKLFGAIRIGNGCKIGANAVVTHSFEDNAVIVGVPGRNIGKILK